MGSALARHYNCNLCFNQDPDQRAYYDYVLYDLEKGWLKTIEQTDDYFTKDLEGTLCLELFTFNNGKTKQGKLNYSRANKFLFVLNQAKQIIILDRVILKNFVVRSEESCTLLTTTPDDLEEWKKKHDTLPTTCALLPIQECLHQDPNGRVIPFSELQLHHYEKLQFQQSHY